MKEELKMEIQRKIAERFSQALGPKPQAATEAERDAARLRWQETVGEKYEVLVRAAMRKVS